MAPTMASSHDPQAGGPTGGPFAALGRFAVRRRWPIVVAWAALLLIALPFAPRAVDALRAGGFILDDLESARAKAVLQTELGAPPSAVVVVLHSDSLLAGTPAFEAAAAEAIAGVADAPYVARIVPHTLATRQVSADGHTAYDIVLLTIAPDDSPAALPGIQAALGHPAGMEVALAGGPAFYGDVQDVSESDLQRSELISLPLAAIALLIVFGSVVAGVLPLAVGGAAVVVALATIFAVASATPMSIFVLNLATLLGLGLGVDYSLLLTSRFREQIAGGRPDDPDLVARAVEETVATAGRAVFFSGLTVLLGLLGLVLFEFMILRSVGIAGAIVVFLAVASAVTLLPALLAIVGTRIDTLSIRRTTPSDEPDGRWSRLARWVMRRPIAVLIPTLGLLLLLGWPFLHVRFNAPDSTILPASVPSRAAFDRLAETFGEGEFAPLTLAIRTDGPATSPENLAALYEYSRRLAADPRVTRVEGLVDVDERLGLDQYQLLYGDPNGPRDRFIAMALAATTKDDLTTFTVFTPFGPNRAEGRELVADAARRDRPARATGRRRGARRGRRGRRRRRGRPGRGGLPADGPVHHHDDLHRPVPAPALGRPADQGAGHEHAVDRRVVRRPRLDLPGRQPLVGPRVPAARVRRDDPAGDPLLRPVRAVDGLRGLPAVADEGGLGPDPRQHRGRRARPRAERTDRDVGGADRGRRRAARSPSPTSSSSRRSGSAWRSRWPSTRPSSGRCSCRRRCGCSASGTGGRPSWARRVPAVGTAVLLLAVVLAGCTGPILAAPPAAHPTTPPASAPPSRPPDPIPIELPRDDAPMTA